MIANRYKPDPISNEAFDYCFVFGLVWFGLVWFGFVCVFEEGRRANRSFSHMRIVQLVLYNENARNK